MMIEILVIVLGKVCDAFIGELAGKITDEIWTMLKGDPAKKELQRAIGAAIQRYAFSNSMRVELSQPLMEKDGFLTDRKVAAELAQLVRFDREPNAAFIGQRWKAAMDYPPPWCDFTKEARDLLSYLQQELRGTDVFRPIFDAKSLDATAANTAIATESLSHIEAQQAQLLLLMNRFSQAVSVSIRDQVLDYTNFISEKTQDFVGRAFVFDAIDHFIHTHPRGYFFVRGDPGIGKSALAAQLVKTRGYIHHFNKRSDGITRAEQFIRNVCAQLITVYHLNYAALPDAVTKDASFMTGLLNEVSTKLGPQEKTIIVVDALDEADSSGQSSGSNILYLPASLPRGIYLIVTSRMLSLEQLDLRIECEQGTLDIEHDSSDNMADIRKYVEGVVGRPGIQAYITAQGIDDALFIDHLVEKSEGNFVYLRYVLPEIEDGAYKGLGLDALPVGLQNYYEDHWRRMRGTNTKEWLKYKLPVVMALVVVKVPVSIGQLVGFSGVQDTAQIHEVLLEWKQFLHEEIVPGQPKRYSIYHASFHDFIARKEEVEQEQGVSRKNASTIIADDLNDLWTQIKNQK
ncbi:MAG TPA: ATP-binding protein [Ktedonobacteraceae bacterium]|nr:ATP-binding protein [Ktedonobacteraceae bacterium]